MFVQKQAQAQLVHLLALGERKRSADEAAQPLAQDVVEPLNVRLYWGNKFGRRLCP